MFRINRQIRCRLVASVLRSAALSLLMQLELFAQPTQAQSLSNVCEILSASSTPCGILTNVRIINVFWSSTSLQDFDTAAQTAAAVEGGPVASHSAVEQFVASLLHSNYFGGLQQYGAQTQTRILPSIIVGSCIPQNPALSDLFNNPSHVDTIIQCVLNNNPGLNGGPGQLLMMFVLPSLDTPSLSSADNTFCKSQGTALHPGSVEGWHDTQTLPYAIIPLGCDFIMSNAEEPISHELVESITDSPVGLGWVAPDGDEIADLCESGPDPTTSFLAQGEVANYASGPAGVCASNLTPKPPTLISATACGSGKGTAITITGDNLPFPSWDMISNSFPGQTLYVSVEVTNVDSVGWIGGLPVNNTFNANLTVPGFGSFTANASTIVISGFDINYGTLAAPNTPQIIQPDASIEIFVTDPTSGATSNITASVSAPTLISSFSDVPIGAPRLLVTQTASVGGILEDGASPMGNPVTVSSGGYGQFGASFTAPNVAGTAQVTATVQQSGGFFGPTATLSIPVLPDIESISPDIGPTAGRQMVTITGSGFDPTLSNNSVQFGTKAATINSVQAHSLQVSSPPTSEGGDGHGTELVTVTVNGVSGAQLDYTYEPPNTPEFSWTQKLCQSGALTVNVYDDNGRLLPVNPAAYQLALSGPANSIVTSSGNASSVVLQPGASVQVASGGPFTAVFQTPVAGSGNWSNGASTTQSFRYLSGGILCNGFLTEGVWSSGLLEDSGVYGVHTGPCPIA